MADFGVIFEKPVRFTFFWVTLYGDIGQLRDKTSTCMYDKQITIVTFMSEVKSEYRNL